MENEEELLNTLNDIKSDVAIIAFCVFIVTVLIIIEILLSIIP